VVSTWEEYFTVISKDLLEKGARWLGDYDFGYEWVFYSGTLAAKQQKLKGALKLSPVGVSVYAWVQDENGLYIKPEDTNDNHWCVIYNYVEGKYWEVFDTYDASYKRLEWDYNSKYAMRYNLEKKKEELSPTTFYRKLWNFIKAFFLWIPLKTGII